mmetsp:Transcript_86053/g.240590  ORF Transcript_86053/g.240590 Transcript_86053/m.240590 type:complete len:258 (+) Transcript_86053:1802-2575(+)
MVLVRGADHAAPEGQWLCRIGAEVRVQSDVPERHGGVEGLAYHRVGQRLRLRDPRAVLEKADGFEVRAVLVKVEHDGDRSVPLEPFAARPVLRLATVHKRSLRVEANAFRPVTQEKARLRRGEAHFHVLRGPVLTVASMVLGERQKLDDIHLEHVAAGLDAHVRARPGQEMLHAALANWFQQRAAGTRQNVERGVPRVEHDRLRDRPLARGLVSLLFGDFWLRLRRRLFLRRFLWRLAIRRIGGSNLGLLLGGRHGE